MKRRSTEALLAICAALAFCGATRPPDGIFQDIVRQAKAAAAAPFQPNEMSLPQALQDLNYDSYRRITFRREEGLWFGDRTKFQVQFFHPGYLYRRPVAINQVVDGEVRAVEFSPKFFRYPNLDLTLLKDSKLGFAGFRLLYPLNHRRPVDEVISFLGPSYFRALAAGEVYGISARGLAINTGENLTEEFPAFREFWLCRPAAGAREVEFYALLDGPSVAGAYRFVLRPGADTQVEIEAHLFFRKSVQAFGLAPLTSMFWRGERDPLLPNDRRPEVHDSDGLLIGSNEWHPLAAVSKVTTQDFPLTSPKSFALLQRDRDPAHYHDAEAKYARRPSVRVEPLGDWGAGFIRLLQLPATNEYNDNVVVFWQPEKLPGAGDELDVKYRLHWFSRESNKP